MSILDEIVKHKREEVRESKSKIPVEELMSRNLYSRPTISLVERLNEIGASGIIAEIKRKSPSKGIFNASIDVPSLAIGYDRAGVSGISILTDVKYFGGSQQDLLAARPFVSCPILRKDFMIDVYQIEEARSIGADVILLIAACLTVDETREFTAYAHALNLEVLLEIHDENELNDHLGAGADIIGVNNRNLKSFEVSIETSKRIAPVIPEGIVKISESGIDATETIVSLRSFGYQGFLMGENFMKQPSPEIACHDFIKKLKHG